MTETAVEPPAPTTPVPDPAAAVQPSIPASYAVIANYCSDVESTTAGLRTHTTDLEGPAKVAAEHLLDILDRRTRDTRDWLANQQGSPVAGAVHTPSPSPPPAMPVQDTQEHPGGTAAAQRTREEGQGNDQGGAETRKTGAAGRRS